MALPKTNLLQLTNAELKIAAHKLFELLGQGKTDEEARTSLNLTRGQYEQLQQAMYRHQTDSLITRTTEETYINYIIAQTANMRDLTEMIREFKHTKQYNAMVGAIRARVDILDHVIKKGQEFGIIEKRPEEKRIIAGVLVANLTNPDLRKLIVRELSQLDRMRTAYGDGQPLLEIDPGAVYLKAEPKLKQIVASTSSGQPEPKTKQTKRVKVKALGTSQEEERERQEHPAKPPQHLRFAQTSTMQSGLYPDISIESGKPQLEQKQKKNKPKTDPRLKKVKHSRTQRAKNTKRYAGRRVVKKKRLQ